jgi:hypothetical protein
MMRWMVERPTLYSVARSARDTSPSAYRRRMERRAGSGSLGCLPLSLLLGQVEGRAAADVGAWLTAQDPAWWAGVQVDRVITPQRPNQLLGAYLKRRDRLVCRICS